MKAGVLAVHLAALTVAMMVLSSVVDLAVQWVVGSAS